MIDLNVIDKLKEFGGMIPIKKKNAQTTTESLHVFLGQKQAQAPMKWWWNAVCWKSSNVFLFLRGIKRYSRQNAEVADFSGMRNRTIRHHIKEPIMARNDANWKSLIIPTMTKRNSNPTKMTTIDTPLKRLRKRQTIRYPE